MSKAQNLIIAEAKLRLDLEAKFDQRNAFSYARYFGVATAESSIGNALYWSDFA